MSGGKYLRRVNIAEASALILLADRANLKNSTVGNEHLDTDTLFQYLGIEKLIESDIYFSAELFFENNMAILNTSAVRTANRRTAEKPVQIDAEEQRMHRAFTTVTPQKSLQPIDRRTGGVMARHNSKKSLIRSIHNDTKEGEIVRTPADMSPTLQTGANIQLFVIKSLLVDSPTFFPLFITLLFSHFLFFCPSVTTFTPLSYSFF